MQRIFSTKIFQGNESKSFWKARSSVQSKSLHCGEIPGVLNVMSHQADYHGENNVKNLGRRPEIPVDKLQLSNGDAVERTAAETLRKMPVS